MLQVVETSDALNSSSDASGDREGSAADATAEPTTPTSHERSSVQEQPRQSDEAPVAAATPTTRSGSEDAPPSTPATADADNDDDAASLPSTRGSRSLTDYSGQLLRPGCCGCCGEVRCGDSPHGEWGESAVDWPPDRVTRRAAARSVCASLRLASPPPSRRR